MNLYYSHAPIEGHDQKDGTNMLDHLDIKSISSEKGNASEQIAKFLCSSPSLCFVKIMIACQQSDHVSQQKP